MQTRSAEKITGNFLVTTALEEFWDTSRPLLFLGSWCKKFDRKDHWTQPGARMVPSPYQDATAVQEASRRVDEVYEVALSVLASRLNAIHGVSHSSRYWRILLGPWLHLYVSATYDRFLHIKQAQACEPGFVTLGLSEDAFIVPTDTLDFACALSEDAYNLQIFTKIMKALGLEFPVRPLAASQNPLYGKLLGNSWQRRLVSWLARLYASLSARVSQTVLLRHAYFPKPVELKLAVQNFACILPMWHQSATLRSSCPDQAKRKALAQLDFGNGEYEKCLSAMLDTDLPQCFVENYDRIGKEASAIYPKKVNAIFSANAWYYDETFKRWAAVLGEQGAVLLGTQHGGNYGAMKYMASENHETSIVDRYYSWGWTRTDCSATVVPMPATKLLGRQAIGADNAKIGVLWVATSASRYLFQYPMAPMYFEEYLDWQARFATALSQRIAGLMRFRPHYESYGWSIVERLQARAPEIRCENWSVPFASSLADCRLYVCDHLSTTFVEALSANKPTILFWNPQANLLREAAQPYFEALRNAGILFYTPAAAASAVERIYDDVESWWNSPERQEAVAAFCRQFARTAPNALAAWGRELTGVAARATPEHPAGGG